MHLFFSLLFSIIIFGCQGEKSIQNKKENMNDYKPAKQIDFGSAIVTGEIVSLQKKEKFLEVFMRVDTIHSIGAGTPPIAVGSEITLLEENNSDREFRKLLETNIETKLRLKIVILPSMKSEERFWKVISIYK